MPNIGISNISYIGFSNISNISISNIGGGGFNKCPILVFLIFLILVFLIYLILVFLMSGEEASTNAQYWYFHLQGKTVLLFAIGNRMLTCNFLQYV